MKVKIEYTEEVSDEYRRALNFRYGKTGLATREDLKQHFQIYGNTIDDDIMQEYNNHLSRRKEESEL